MRQPPSPADVVPRWLMLVGSLVIVLHLGAVVFGALHAPSGPWPMPMSGQDMAGPPQFATDVAETVGPKYLRPLRMAHNYHFESNRTGVPGVKLEIRLKDKDGNVIETVYLPDPDANALVRNRQELLALGLGQDQPIMPPQGGDPVAPPGQDPPKVRVWNMVKPPEMEIKEIFQHEVTAQEPVMGPSDFSLMLARTYARALCREHGAASAQIIRHHKPAVPPAAMILDQIQPQMFDPQSSNFGEFSR